MRKFEEQKYQDFLADFNLFICETFGYRNAVYYNEINEEPTFMAHEREFDIYIRLREDGMTEYPDNTIILVRTSFSAFNGRQDKDRQLSNFEKLLRFFIAYEPQYGFNTIAFDGLGVDNFTDKTEYGFTPQAVNRYQSTPISMLTIPESTK